MSRFFTSALKQLTPYVPGEQPKQGRFIKLNTNESPFAPAPAVCEIINKTEIENLRLYSDPACKTFLAQLANTYGVKETQVFAGNGSDEVLAFCFQSFCENGVAFADITYGFYPVFTQIFRCATTIVPLQKDFTISVKDYQEIDSTIIIANPNAPTGLELSQNEIEQLLQQNKNRLIIIDEAYVDFGAESAVPLLQKYDNLLVVGTFSKSRNLAGARLGYAIAGEELIADLNTIKFSFNPYNVNRLTLLAGTAALQETVYYEACWQSIIQTRRETTAALRELGFTVLDSKTNFIFAGKHPKLSAKYWQEHLRENNILVRYFAQERIDDFVRITIGTAEQMQTLLQITKGALS